MSSDPREAPPPLADAADGGFANSAHPPIQRLNPDLSPEEFGLVFQVSRAEVEVYRTVAEDHAADSAAVTLTQHQLTLHRKQTDGRRQVGIRIAALDAPEDNWMLDAPVHGSDLACASQNDLKALEQLLEAAAAKIHFDMEDCLKEAGKMPLGRLLHLMEAVRLGRPSTYAASLKKLFEDSTVVTLDRASGVVSLTTSGVELGARLQTRCDALTSKEFARTFDAKLTAIADGRLAPQDFLTWVLGLTRPGDALAAVAATKLWHSVDELRASQLGSRNRLDGNGGFISHPTVGAPAPPPLPSPNDE